LNATTVTDSPTIIIGSKKEVVLNYSFPTKALSDEETKMKLYLSPKQGIWIASNQNVLFYDFRSKTCTTVPGSNSNGIAAESQHSIWILSSTVHPLTGDLIVIDDLGK